MLQPERSSTEGPPRPPATILLVDDEPSILRALRLALRQTPWTVLTAGSGAEALATLETTPIDVVVSDQRMPEMTGVELLRQVKSRWPHTQRVMLTGQADQQVIQEAINRSEIFRFVTKPWDDHDLLGTLITAVDAAYLARENRRLLQLTLQKNEELALLNASLEAKVTERTAMISRAKREWEATFDALSSPIAIVDQNYRVRRANRAWADLAGGDLLEGLTRPCFSHLGRETPCPHCPLADVWHATSGSVTREVQWGSRLLVVTAFPWPDDSPTSASHDGSRAPSEGALWAVVTYQDVTDDRRRAEWRLHTERLAAVGRLAGGVAHEINNPLAGILAFAQILLSTPRPPDDKEALDLIEDGAVRCKRIVESLMRFAGLPGDGSRQHVNLQQVTSDTLALFRGQLLRKPGSELRFIGEGVATPTFEADPYAVGQALMDLLHHRLHALPAGGGSLTLSMFSEAPLSGWSLVDTAPALSAAAIEQLADPDLSDPTGLSLAFRVAREHQGRLDVAPVEGGGNRFSLLLGSLPQRPT